MFFNRFEVRVLQIAWWVNLDVVCSVVIYFGFDSVFVI